MIPALVDHRGNDGRPPNISITRARFQHPPDGHIMMTRLKWFPSDPWIQIGIMSVGYQIGCGLGFIYGSGYLQSGSAHRRRTLAYLQSRDEPIKALGSSHMTK